MIFALASNTAPLILTFWRVSGALDGGGLQGRQARQLRHALPVGAAGRFARGQRGFASNKRGLSGNKRD